MDNEQMIRAELTKWDEKHYKMECPICERKIPFKLYWEEHIKNIRETDGNPYGISIIHGEGDIIYGNSIAVTLGRFFASIIRFSSKNDCRYLCKTSLSAKSIF